MLYIKADFYFQQQQLQNHITIHGLPLQKSEDIVNTVVNIGKTLNVDITTENIKSYRAMNNHNKNNTSPIIIVEFNDPEVKQEMQKNYKTNGPIIAAQIVKNVKNSDAEHQKIYINDYLCTYIKHLLAQTKKIQAKCNIKFVWTKNGNVYARHNENSNTFRIRSYKDIDELESRASEDS